MGQCEKILENGERCSNQATPGTRFCSVHGRITFRKVRAEKAADTSPPPKQQVAAPAKSQKEQAEWQAVPSPSGQPPTFPGLRADERNILVGPEGIVWLTGDSAADGQESPFNRLVKLLGFLSQALPLQLPQGQPQVRVVCQPAPGDCLALLRPQRPDAPDLSTFYDAASTAARLVGGRLYVGQKGSFVQYRDDSAPRGYDVPAFRPQQAEKGLLLIAHWGSRRLNPAAFQETKLADFVMEVAPVPGVGEPLPERIYALAARPLYAVLARYFRAHLLRYQLARLQHDGEELILFDIQPNPAATGDAVIPAFVLDYLARLPRVALLRPAGEEPVVLLQWRHRYPLHLPHIRGAFAADELVILSHSPFSNCRVQPTPQFFDGDRLTDVYTRQRATRQLMTAPVQDVPALRLPVLLRADHGPTPAVAALLLTPQETAWLRPLLYRLPGSHFATYLVCQGTELSLLLSQGAPIEGIPFGLPLRRLGDTELFLPLRSRLVPALPWPILRQALAVQDGVYTFLTEAYRLDIAAADFQPLSRTVLAQKRGAAFRLRPLASLPDLQWQPQERPGVQKAPSSPPDVIPAAKVEKINWLDRLAGRGKPQPAEKLPSAGEPVVWPALAQEELDVSAYLVEQAEQHERQGDMLSAAFCYDLLDDAANSARCYRLMAGEAVTP